MKLISYCVFTVDGGAQQEMQANEFNNKRLEHLKGIKIIRFYDKEVPPKPRVKRDRSKPLLEKCGAIRTTGF